MKKMTRNDKRTRITQIELAEIAEEHFNDDQFTTKDLVEIVLLHKPESALNHKDLSPRMSTLREKGWFERTGDTKKIGKTAPMVYYKVVKGWRKINKPAYPNRNSINKKKTTTTNIVKVLQSERQDITNFDEWVEKEDKYVESSNGLEQYVQDMKPEPIQQTSQQVLESMEIDMVTLGEAVYRNIRDWHSRYVLLEEKLAKAERVAEDYRKRVAELNTTVSNLNLKIGQLNKEKERPKNAPLTTIGEIAPNLKNMFRR